MRRAARSCPNLPSLTCCRPHDWHGSVQNGMLAFSRQAQCELRLAADKGWKAAERAVRASEQCYSKGWRSGTVAGEREAAVSGADLFDCRDLCLALSFLSLLPLPLLLLSLQPLLTELLMASALLVAADGRRLAIQPHSTHHTPVTSSLPDTTTAAIQSGKRRREVQWRREHSTASGE